MKGYIEREDLRFQYLEDLLKKEGFEIVQNKEDADFMILGIKSKLIKEIPPHCIVFSFHPIENCHNICFNENESFLQKNAQLTSKGCLEVIDTRNKKVVIFGNGRIASALYKDLLGDATIICRHPKKGQENWDSLSYLDADIMINTVPARLDLRWESLNPKVQIIDLASYPYGFDFDKLHQRGFNIKLLSGVPGKFYPYEAAYIIYEEVMKCLKEKR